MLFHIEGQGIRGTLLEKFRGFVRRILEVHPSFFGQEEKLPDPFDQYTIAFQTENWQYLIIDLIIEQTEKETDGR